MWMEPQSLVIRTDAGPEIGVGHVMRCLALAQAWRDAGGRPTVLAAEMPPTLAERLYQEDVEVVYRSGTGSREEDARQTAALARERGASWIAADGYDFSASWQQIVKESGTRLLLCDDGGRTGDHYVDLVLDTNPQARPEDYSGSPARLLLGPRYVLLRREFLLKRDAVRDTSRANRVLVTLGGADRDNVTLRILEALDRLPHSRLEVAVLIGPANPHLHELRGFAARARHRIGVYANSTDIASWMAWAEIAVAGGGITTWERAYMGLPSVTLVLADNQADVARAADQLGITRNLGAASSLDDRTISCALQSLLEEESARAGMAKRGRELVDGDGVERLLMHLTGAEVRLRPVRNEDAQLLWRWANDPAVRRASFTEEPISWEAHLQWFARKRQEGGCLMFVGFDAEGAPLGQVRIDRRAGGEAAIHVSLASERRGQGWAARLLRAAVDRAARELQVRHIHALIKPENLSSLRAFAKAGFQDRGYTTRAGRRVRHALYGQETT
jgi:UDP-2,4-diacetamido-2,4,6-trideoxy-beta-L-altropyranose hydrolase